MTTPSWPQSFPCPLVEGFAAEIYTAVVRTPFEGGNTRQRRLHRQIPHAFRVSWLVKQSPTWGQMLNWLNINGFSWFTLSLPSALAGLKQKQTVPHAVRLIDDLRTELINTRDGYYWRLEATLEWMPGDSDFGTGGPAFMTGNWNIARSRTLALADLPTDWIVAGTPAAPNNATTYTSGTPAAPAAIL